MSDALTFEKVWELFMETRQDIHEMKEMSKEMSRETDRKMRESDWEMRETDRIISKLVDRFGELPEYLVAPNIADCGLLTD